MVEMECQMQAQVILQVLPTKRKVSLKGHQCSLNLAESDCFVWDLFCRYGTQDQVWNITLSLKI